MRLATAALAASLCLPVFAQPSLEGYVRESMPLCPEPKITMSPVAGSPLPSGFAAFEVKMTGKDASCSARKHVLYSESTGQVFVGSVIPLPPDPRPLTARLSAYGSKVLQRELTATVMPFPLPDGLKAATLTKQTDYGPLSYHAYVDASEQFMMLGVLGNIKESPRKTLLTGISSTDAVRRGNAKGKIEIIELSDFECPACGKAHKQIWPLIEKNLAKINFGRLDLPLFEHHEWAMPAALGARAVQRVAPAKYWEYVDFMFSNQEEIGKQPFDTVFKGWVEDHDIDWAKVEKIYHSPAEQTAVIRQVERAFDSNINSTPTFILNGQPLAYGPEGSFVIDAIRKALGLPPAPAPKKTAAKK